MSDRDGEVAGARIHGDSMITKETVLSSGLSLNSGAQRTNAFLVRVYPAGIGEGLIEIARNEFTIGREDGCNLCLPVPDVSRRHALITSRAGIYFVKDLESRNGTFVNDERVQERKLANGDFIRVGKNILRFLCGDHVELRYHETIYSMMINDGLTGIPNRRFFLESLDRELTRSQRHKRPLALAILDIDHFKKINDTYGHLAGDATLREVARRVSEAIRKDELFARYGGEEFAILLPESAVEEARLVAERVRELIAAEPVDVEGAVIQVTASIGVSTTAGNYGISAEELISQADAKLYQAKSEGRNRVLC